MKKIYLFLLMVFAFTCFSMAQTVENFESIKMNAFDAGANGAVMVVPNPDPSGINISANVGQMERGADGQPWAGWYATIPTALDMDANKYVHVKIWKPRISPVVFKLEKEGGNSGDVFSMSPQTKTEEWEDIVFDFSEKTGTYPIIAFMPDFEDPLTLTEDITLYFDDIILNNSPDAAVTPQQVINVDMNASGMTAGSKVWIAGTLGGIHGSWAEPGTNPANEMLDPDGDGIYTITLPLADGVYAFKFFWGTGWTNGDPAVGGDRSYTVMGNNTLLYVWNVQGYTGAKQLSGASFKLFPNPVTNMLTIQSADLKGVRILDLLGKTVKNHKFQAVNSKQIDMSDLRSGIYFISVETSKGIFTSKIIKK